MNLLRLLPLFSLALFALLPGWNGAWAQSASSDQARLNGGYYLLHDLSKDESQVPMLFIVKQAPAEVSAYAKEVSRTAKQTLKTLDHLQAHDPAIQFDHNPLPQIEKDARDSIKADKQHQLLFGTTGTEFVRAFLVAQIEACSYALNLGKVLADQESDPERSKALRHLSAEWLERRQQAFQILRNY